jgi:hypothetical protein
MKEGKKTFFGNKLVPEEEKEGKGFWPPRPDSGRVILHSMLQAAPQISQSLWPDRWAKAERWSSMI